MGMLSVQRVLSGQLAYRNFLLRPPEPAPQLLVSNPASSIYIGKTLLLHTPFYWNAEKLVNPHVCVVGITGSGKSYLVKTFITRARLVLGASALILDWAGEYADWVRAAGGRVISFGSDGINLLDTGGASPHARSLQVISALEMLTDISSFPAQRRITELAIEKAYARRGFALHKEGQKRKPPTLEDVCKILSRHPKGDSDSAEAARRIRSLLLSSGKSFSAQTISIDSLLSGLICVDLHSLPMESLRSLAGLAILQFVKEKMRASRYSPSKPRLFIVVDEAWKIASDERSDVVSIVREGRKYGFSLIVASQNPTDVHKSIFSNAGTVFAFRLTLASEREYLRSSLSYSDYFEACSHRMGVGQALVHLEFSMPVQCPKNFILERVDGEEILQPFAIRGGNMELSFEKGELLRRLLSAGFDEKQSRAILSEFERKSFSLTSREFASLLLRLGMPRPAILSFLRELGAKEKELLPVFSSISDEEEEVAVSLKGLKEKKQKGDGYASKDRGNPRI
ncbi:MAG: ATP-binding protein [Candidatus Micrarchaeota archaeon]|nr:ATP-binding protein [Candidatus Micrarchaeota archaeon]